MGINAVRSGGVAQLGERLNGIQEVRGSIPLASMAGFGTPVARIRWAREEPAWTRVGLPVRTFPAGIAQLVEHNLAKVGVAGSSPVSRSVSLKFVQVCSSWALVFAAVLLGG
jgi:hypothetical protein